MPPSKANASNRSRPSSVQVKRAMDKKARLEKLARGGLELRGATVRGDDLEHLPLQFFLDFMTATARSTAGLDVEQTHGEHLGDGRYKWTLLHVFGITPTGQRMVASWEPARNAPGAQITMHDLNAIEARAKHFAKAA